MIIPQTRLALILAVTIAIFPIQSHAQEKVISASLNVDQAVALALQNNLDVSAAQHEVAAARQGLHAAKSLANPEIIFAPSLTGVGSDTEFLAQQPLEINGTRTARTRAADARLRAVTADAQARMHDIVYDTKSAYNELIRKREQLSLARAVLASTQEFDRLTRQQVEFGSRPAIEQTQSAIEVTRARQQVALAQAQDTRALAALDTLIGRDPAAPIDQLAAPTTNYPSLDPSALTEQALAARSDIKSADATQEALRQDAQAIRAEGRPDIAPQYRATTVTKGVHDSGFGIAITLPILDYGSRRGRVRQADEAAKAQSDRVLASRRQAALEISQALAQVRATDAVLNDYPTGLLDQSKSLLDASRLGYQEGKTSITAYLDAQRTYRGVQSDFINAEVDSAIAHAELERATASYPITVIPSNETQNAK